MGIIDRIVRIQIAFFIIALYFFQVIEGTLGIILIVLASVLVLTSVVRFCSLYPLLGINTCEKN